jgi:aconitate hydratase
MRQKMTPLSVSWKSFSFEEQEFRCIDLNVIERSCSGFKLSELPFSLRVVLESNIRRADTSSKLEQVVSVVAARQSGTPCVKEVAIYPTRILLQDYTGIPVLVDLCSLRQSAVDRGLDPELVNPKIQVDLVVDHSIVVNASGRSDAEQINSDEQHALNKERFAFLKWTAQAFKNLRVIPPDSGICHQVNLELLATGIVVQDDVAGQRNVFPELVIGADSHTTTINSLGILGWGVGGIEALSALLGGSLQIPMPKVVGVRLTGRIGPGVTATDCVLTLTETLRRHGVVEKFVEFFGEGVASLSVPDRATISNMAPEYGATCAFFPWDEQATQYMRSTGRSNDGLMEAYAKHAKLWHDPRDAPPHYDEVIEFDLVKVQATVAGPKRPEERRNLNEVAQSFLSLQSKVGVSAATHGGIPDGAVLLAAITSCTNTSNPSLMIAAGLLAKKAVLAGLQVPAWVKTSFAPGSLVVGQYMAESGLQKYLDKLGFQVCGYGCTTCIGNSGSLNPVAHEAVVQGLVGCAVVSGNRNFSGRVQQQLSFNYLASPPLVLAYALAGRITFDLNKEPLGVTAGQPVFLADLWPTPEEIQQVYGDHLKEELFVLRRDLLTSSSMAWNLIPCPKTRLYDWAEKAGYVSQPPFFLEGSASSPLEGRVVNAKTLLLLGDGVTTDDISPAGRIAPESLAGKYLLELGVSANRLQTFGARRGNWDVMLRGVFTNPNLVNEMLPEARTGYTRFMPSRQIMPIGEAAKMYQSQGNSAVIVAGKNYGTGSSRDDAARSTRLLGVSAVIAESFERIHRSNLVALGVLPMLFTNKQSRLSLELDGSEVWTLEIGLIPQLAGELVSCLLSRADGRTEPVILESCLRKDELVYFLKGGILPYLVDEICGPELSPSALGETLIN